MAPIILYLSKTILCSAILFAYYAVALRNKPHHQFNRFYLLASLVVSITIPLVTIYVPVPTSTATDSTVQLLTIVSGNFVETEFGGNSGSFASYNLQLFYLIYSAVAVTLLIPLLNSILTIIRLSRTADYRYFSGVHVKTISHPQAPFTFFRTIYWNSQIDLDSETGKRIFHHEREHVRQYHSLDRLLAGLTVTLFWINPVFWLIRKELNVVHEFAADQAAIPDKKVRAFSEMILVSTFPTSTIHLASTFFNSSIKRRLTMLSSFKKPGKRLLAKWLILPLLLVLFTAFSLHKKTAATTASSADFVLIIDAGHGGSRTGAVASDGTLEKDLTLALSRKIKELNKDAGIRIIMTRESDVDASLQERVQAATTSKADAFLSIHINRGESSMSGIQLLMTRNENELTSKSQLLGSLLAQELNQVYRVDGQLRKGADKRVYVLDAPEVDYPSLLIEFGNLNNADDLQFIKSSENQAKLANQVLNAVKRFAANK